MQYRLAAPFRGLEGDFVLGLEQFTQMFVIALTIVAGIMVGYTVVRPEPTLKRSEPGGKRRRAACRSDVRRTGRTETGDDGC